MTDESEWTWSVSATSRFDRDLARLPGRAAEAIIEFATTVLPANPERLSKPLTGDLLAYGSARRGDYRILLRLDYETGTILLHHAAHRAHVYRPD